MAYLLAYMFAALAYVLYRLGDCYIFNNMSLGLFFTCARCVCLCVRLLMPGQRWTFLSVVPVRPALLARVCARCARPLCVAALAPVVRAYMVDSPVVLLLAVLAANFFEIVFKPSISVPPSSAGMGGTTLYCYAG